MVPYPPREPGPDSPMWNDDDAIKKFYQDWVCKVAKKRGISSVYFEDDDITIECY